MTTAIWTLLLVKIIGGLPTIATADVPSLSLCRAVAADFAKHENVKVAKCVNGSEPI